MKTGGWNSKEKVTVDEPMKLTRMTEWTTANRNQNHHQHCTNIIIIIIFTLKELSLTIKTPFNQNIAWQKYVGFIVGHHVWWCFPLVGSSAHSLFLFLRLEDFIIVISMTSPFSILVPGIGLFRTGQLLIGCLVLTTSCHQLSMERMGTYVQQLDKYSVCPLHHCIGQFWAGQLSDWFYNH